MHALVRVFSHELEGDFSARLLNLFCFAVVERRCESPFVPGVQEREMC